MFDGILITHLVLAIKYLYSFTIAEIWFIRELWMCFVLRKESKFSNFYIMNVTTFY